MARDNAGDNIQDIDSFFEAMRTAANSTSLLLVHGVPHSTADWSWDGEMGDETEFISIAAHANASLLYFDIETFDLESLVSAQIIGSELVSEYEDDYLETASPIIKAVLRKFDHWVERDGQSSMLILQFVANGVCHQFVQSPDWFDRFVEEISQHIDVLEESSRVESESETQQSDATKKIRAEELARSDRYARAKNDAQRRYITKEMFPNEDESSLYSLLELAALIYWDEVEPERETKMVQQAASLMQSGVTVTNIAAQLGMTKDRVNRLLATAEAQSQAE